MEKNDFIGYIAKDGGIMARGYGEQDSLIGYDMQEYNTLKTDRDACFSHAEKYLKEQEAIFDIIQKYPEIMQEIKNANIKIRLKPVPPEQMVAEQSKFNQQVLSVLGDLTKEIQSIKKNNSKNNSDIL